MTKKILIGKVISPFGIKGEMKIVSFCENPTQIEKYSLFDKNNDALKLKISNKNKTVIGSTSSGNAILIVKIDGVNDRNTSESLRDAEIFVERAELKKLKDDEFYYVDLLGLDVVDMEDKKIGKVLNIEEHGAGGVIEIEFLAENLPNNYKKIENFPFKNELFPEVNLEKGFIKMDLPEIIDLKDK